MKTKHTILSLGSTSKVLMGCAVVANLLVITSTVVVIDRLGFVINRVTSGTLTDELLTRAIIIMVAALCAKVFFMWVVNKVVYTISSGHSFSIRGATHEDDPPGYHRWVAGHFGGGRPGRRLLALQHP